MIFDSAYMHLEKRLKRQVSGSLHTFRVLSHIGFEGILSSELSRLGFNTKASFVGGICIEAKWADSWKILAFSRTARRLDMQIAKFHAENFKKLEYSFNNIPWELYYPENTLPEIKAKCKKSRLYHSDAIAERLKPILLKRLFSNTHLDSNISNASYQRIIIDFENDVCSVYVDMAGNALYKRGYNRFVEHAPLQETLASSILLAAGIQTSPKLLDLMCGSATFSLEAGAMALQKYTGFSRTFAIHNQPAFGSSSYKNMLNHAPESNLIKGFSIYTADKSLKSVETASKNAQICEVNTLVKPCQADFFKGVVPHEKGSLLVLNPPYGIRLQTDTQKLYTEIGKKIRMDYADCKLALLCPDHKTLQAFSPGEANVIRTNHGGLDIFVVFIKTHKL